MLSLGAPKRGLDWGRVVAIDPTVPPVGFERRLEHLREPRPQRSLDRVSVRSAVLRVKVS
jgi:hypothetical protein